MPSYAPKQLQPTTRSTAVPAPTKLPLWGASENAALTTCESSGPEALSEPPLSGPGAVATPAQEEGYVAVGYAESVEVVDVEVTVAFVEETDEETLAEAPEADEAKMRHRGVRHSWHQRVQHIEEDGPEGRACRAYL